MKINFDKIICINSGSLNAQQLFAVCETYRIGFEAVYESKMAGVTMEWITEDRDVIAYVINGKFIIGEKFNPLSKKEYDRIKKIKPVKTPKMPKGDSTLGNYKAFVSKGYEIGTKSIDSKIAKVASIDQISDVVIEESKFDLPVVLEIDAILDKIGKYGISSITAEERSFLDNQ